MLTDTPPLEGGQKGGDDLCVNPQWIAPFIDGNGELTYRMFDSATVNPSFSVLDTTTGELAFPFQVGCGKCLDCIALHREQWVHRIQDEMKLHEHNCFVTLTYKETDGDLKPDDFTKWLKRLRRQIEPVQIRYFGCGEYGTKGKRPHYHCIIFGYDFPDKTVWTKSHRGYFQYRSELLEKTWTFGISTIVDCTNRTCGYASKDFQKLLPLAEGRQQPFVRMSRMPGIGADGWNRSVKDGKLWHDGKSTMLPRYYKQIAEREGISLADVHRLNAIRAEARQASPDYEGYLRRYEKLLEKKLTK